MSAKPIDPSETFWYSAAVIAFNSPDHGKWALYERLKAFYVSSFPDSGSDEYDAAMQRIARMAGV